MRRKRLLFSGIVALAAAGAGALWLLRRPARVAVAPIASSATLPMEVTLPGRIRAQQVVAVPSPADGTVEMMAVEAGQDVYEGQLLGRIRNTGLESAQQQALLELQRAAQR